MMRFLLVACWLLCALHVSAQEQSTTDTKGQLHGNVQTLFQNYNPDDAIGAQVPDAKAAMNTFGNFTYTYGQFTAGVRFESYQNAILGFPNRFKGSGIGSRYVRYNSDNLDITVGNFYEQFGNGLSFRTYWEPNLGIDNAMDGVRVIFKPFKGLSLKAVYGQQRFDFDSRIIL